MALNDVETVPGWKSWLPTKKWWATLVLGLASILAHGLVSEDFGATERAELGTLLIALAGGYFKSNDKTVGGIPGAVREQVEGPSEDDADTGFEDENIPTYDNQKIADLESENSVVADADAANEKLLADRPETQWKPAKVEVQPQDVRTFRAGRKTDTDADDHATKVLAGL